MKANELRAKAAAELEQSLLDLRKEQFNLRMQHGAGQQPRPSVIRKVRKDIARIKTILNDRQAGN